MSVNMRSVNEKLVKLVIDYTGCLKRVKNHSRVDSVILGFETSPKNHTSQVENAGSLRFSKRAVLFYFSSPKACLMLIRCYHGLQNVWAYVRDIPGIIIILSNHPKWKSLLQEHAAYVNKIINIIAIVK